MRPSPLMTLKQKLSWLTVLVSSLVLFMAAALFTLYEGISVYKETSRQISTLSRLLASGAVQPLATRDKLAAQGVLNQVAGSERVVTAYLLDTSDRALAHYLRVSKNPQQFNAIQDMQLFELEARQLQEGKKVRKEISWLEDGYFSLFLPVIFEGEELGSLYVRADMVWFPERFKLTLLLLLLALGGSIALSFLLSNHFQKKIVSSAASVADHVNRVISDNNWRTVDVDPVTREFATLFNGLNDLMRALSDRDKRLNRHQIFLEEEVRKRTKELESANRELRKAKSSAEKANEAKSLFLANVSHEIRTPMVGVLGMAELLCNSDLDDKHRELAETVYRSAQSLMTLLEDLLDFSKIEAGRLSLADEPFNLRQVLEDGCRLMAPRAFEKGLSLHVLMLPMVPEKVSGDSGRIRQMLLNLVGNAIKFTHSGHVAVSLSHQPGPGDGFFQLEVSDTGEGVPPHLQAKIFESFEQGDHTEKSKSRGTGLGLAIVRDLAMLMGGDVQMTSVPGQGSSFVVKIPLRILDEQGFDPSVRLHLNQNAALLATSSDILCAHLEKCLSGWGLHTQTVDSVEALVKGLKKFSENEHDVFLVCDNDFLAQLPDIFAKKNLKSIILLQSPAAKSLPEYQQHDVAVHTVSLPLQLNNLAGALLRGTEPETPAGTNKDKHLPVIKLASSRKSPPRILVVEDNPDSQKLLKLLLSAQGYAVTLVGNGQEALDVITNESFDLTFMDCQMPVLDGFETTRKLRQEGVQMPIVALTAFGRNEEFQKCIDAGMDDFLTKPFRQKSLYQVLEKWGV